VKRTLVIQLGRLGDVIQTTPLLLELSEADPTSELDLLVVRPNEKALHGLRGISTIHTVGEDLKWLDDRIAAGFEGRAIPSEAREALHELRLPHYNRVINASHAALGCWMTGQIPCETREGGVINDRGECLYEGGAHVYRIALLGFREQNWFNLVDLLRCCAPRVPRHRLPGLYAAKADRLPFALPQGRKVALNPGASESHRRWPSEHFARLAENLAAAGLCPILVGAPSDREACGTVQAGCKVTLLNYAGHTSIPEMARLLSEVELLISADTGAVHVASAVGTRVLGLYGASAYFSETAPWGEGHLILQSPLGTPVSGIEPELVIAAARQRLGLLNEGTLRTELHRGKQAAWETQFLAAGTDPVGGLCYRPMQEEEPKAGDLFTRALRHAFALEFSGGAGDVSLEYAKDWWNLSANGENRELDERATDLLQRTASVVQALEDMMGAAEKCEELSKRTDEKTAAGIQSIAPLLMRSMEALRALTQNAEPAAFKPVVHYLDWRLRMMAALPPAETFAHHLKEFRTAASLLCRAGSMLGELVLKKAPAVH